MLGSCRTVELLPMTPIEASSGRHKVQCRIWPHLSLYRVVSQSNVGLCAASPRVPHSLGLLELGPSAAEPWPAAGAASCVSASILAFRSGSWSQKDVPAFCALVMPRNMASLQPAGLLHHCRGAGRRGAGRRGAGRYCV